MTMTELKVTDETTIKELHEWAKQVGVKRIALNSHGDKFSVVLEGTPEGPYLCFAVGVHAEFTQAVQQAVDSYIADVIDKDDDDNEYEEDDDNDDDEM
jgi:hypothetical protein